MLKHSVLLPFGGPVQSCSREMLNFPTNKHLPFQVILHVFSGFHTTGNFNVAFFKYYFPPTRPYFLIFLSACWPAETNPGRLRRGRQMGPCSTFSFGAVAKPSLHVQSTLATQALWMQWNSGRDSSSMWIAQIFVRPAASRTGRSPGHRAYSTVQHHSDGFVFSHTDNPIVLYKGFGHAYVLSCEMVPFSGLPCLN